MLGRYRRSDLETMREWAEMMLEEINEKALFMDGHDSAIIGITDTRVVYDERKIIEGLMEEGCTEEDAWDHYGFNIQGSLVGRDNDDDYPIIIRTPDPMDVDIAGETAKLER